MTQEKTDVFISQIGNIAPNEKVIVRIRYITEVTTEVRSERTIYFLISCKSFVVVVVVVVVTVAIGSSG